jgi:hypothetical protein
MILAVMPEIYPVIISRVNGRLIERAVFARIFLITDIGQESPKQISINISNISDIIKTPF